MIQIIDHKCRTLAYILPAGGIGPGPTFVTPDECSLQAGYLSHPAGYEVPRHFHNPIRRELVGTTEVLYIASGRCVVEFYDDDQRPVSSRDLVQGDLIVIVAGGHGFKMVEDTTILEVKQGPYPGPSEKTRF